MLDIFSHYPVSEKYLNCHQVRVEPRLACRGSLPYITHQALECFWVVLVRAHRTVPKVVFKLKKYLLKFLHTLHLSIPEKIPEPYSVYKKKILHHGWRPLLSLRLKVLKGGVVV